ncbi:hypothetical protein [Pararhizobium sp. A13]|uniref:hypothetical protein n=1 Tax=Pararhizobium sp. A13 TaxID=3133975 RepID=UPI0032530DEF
MSVAKQSSAFLLRLLMFAIVGATAGATLAVDESNSKEVSLKYWISFRNVTPILSGKTCHLDRKCTIYQDADRDRGFIISITISGEPRQESYAEIDCEKECFFHNMKHRIVVSGTPSTKVTFYTGDLPRGLEMTVNEYIGQFRLLFTAPGMKTTAPAADGIEL